MKPSTFTLSKVLENHCLVGTWSLAEVLVEGFHRIVNGEKEV